MRVTRREALAPLGRESPFRCLSPRPARSACRDPSPRLPIADLVHVRGVDDDPPDPRLDVGAPTKVGASANSAHEGVVNGIYGRLLLASDGPSDADELLVADAVDVLELSERSSAFLTPTFPHTV